MASEMTIPSSGRPALSVPRSAPTIEEVEQDVQRKRERRAARQRRSSVVYPVVVLFVLIATWEEGTQIFHVPAFLLPSPSAILSSIEDHWITLLQQTGRTSIEIALGYLLSIIVGIPLALGIFLWPPFARSIYPLLVSTQAMPKVAVAPLLVVWFGFGLMPKVLIAFLVAFFPIVINTAVGLQAIEPETIYLARSMGLSATATFFKIRLPNALPSIFGGLKIAITLAVVGAVVGEFVGGDAGLGYLLMTANGSMDTPLLFAGIATLTALGSGLFLLVEFVERIVIPRHLIANNSSLRDSA